MAEPITTIVRSNDDEELWRAWQELWETPGQREAVERTLDLLRALNERGLLDAARSSVEGGPAVQESIRRFLTESEHLRLAQNLRAIYEVVSAIDLGSIVGRSASSPVPGAPPREAARPMTLLELRRRLRDPDVSEGMRTVLETLAQVGRLRRRT